jgi:hypothetical protein
LRQAVTNAMATPEDDTISFGVNGTIKLNDTLPDVTKEGGALAIDATGKSVTIDGRRQPDRFRGYRRRAQRHQRPRLPAGRSPHL